MKITKKMGMLLLVLLMLLAVAALAEEIMPLADVPHEHYYVCSDLTECSECHEPYTGTEAPDEDHITHIIKENAQYEYDESMHWMPCVCGKGRLKPEEHRRSCNEEVCSVCGNPYKGDNGVEHQMADKADDEWHWEECDICHEATDKEAHIRDCLSQVCSICREAYSGDNVKHALRYDYNPTTHWYGCSNCDYVEGEPEPHSAGSTPGVCGVCGHTYESVEPEETETPDVTEDPDATETPDATEDPDATETPDATEDPDATETPDATEGPEATETPDATEGPDATEMPDATESPDATETPDATEEPEGTEEPDATEEPDMTEEPGATETPKATATPAKSEGQIPVWGDADFLARFQGNSILAADGELASDGQTETVVLTVTEEDGCIGGLLTVYAANAREDGVIVNLRCQYEPEAMQRFLMWQQSIMSVNLLREADSYHSLIELAQALVKALLPETTEDEVDEMIVRILRSGFDGTLMESDMISTAFDEDINGDVVGYLEEEGYEFFLVLCDEEIALLVRELEA